jgi:hypothetical protein
MGVMNWQKPLPVEMEKTERVCNELIGSVKEI